MRNPGSRPFSRSRNAVNAVVVVASLQNKLRQQRRQRRERQRARVEQPLDLHVPAAHRIAHHHEIRLQSFESSGVVTLVQLDAGLRQHGAHRRINAGVGTEHLVPVRARQQRRVAHRRPANAHEIDPHASCFGARHRGAKHFVRAG
jgi:hypothetical protein